jgi:para-nitrobenzyl esterase
MLSRSLRHGLTRSVISSITALLLISAALAQPPKPIKVDGGLLQGTVEDGLTIYRGIPYAAPPVGELRWRPPQPAPKWQGTRVADQYGRACIQTNAAITKLPAPSEDCLYLNVWTPAKSVNEKVPVMVWIHGGGFVAGTPAERTYDGAWLAKNGVLVVSIGYRLGVMGFLSHPELSAESEKHVSGNYGLLDMIAGLNWVQKNISALGGNPNRVTIFGESAGAAAVSILCASPLSKGLFHGAIAESGAFFAPVRAGSTGPGDGVNPLASAEKAGAEWAKNQGAASIQELRKLPADTLQAASMRRPGSGGMMTGPSVTGPNVDGWVVPGDQYKLYQAGRYNDVPVMVGYNSDEGATFGGAMSHQAYVDSVRTRYGASADKLLAVYPGGDTPAEKRTARNLMRDSSFGSHSWSWARLQTQTGKSRVFYYFFDVHPDYPADSPKAGFGSPHASELPYLFDDLSGPNHPAPVTPADHKMAEVMRAYWTNFAKTGDPNGPGVPKWTAYDANNAQTLHFTFDSTQMGPVVNQEGLKVLDEYFAWRRSGQAEQSTGGSSTAPGGQSSPKQ